MGRVAKTMGCAVLGCLVLPLAAGFGLLGWYWMTDLTGPPPKLESKTLTQALPSLQDPGTAIPPFRPDGALDAATNAGVVRLDIAAAEVRVESGRPGEPIRLEADYDSTLYTLQADLREDQHSWTYEVSLRPRSWMRMVKSREADEARLVLWLPPDHPLILEGEIGLAESELRLGGLALAGLDLSLGAGDHAILFHEPLTRPMLFFRVDSGVGQVRVDGLGYASPAVVDIDHGTGDLEVGLDGPWRGDSEVRVEQGLGECEIQLPHGTARSLVHRAGVALGEYEVHEPTAELAADAPEVQVSVSLGIGQLSVH